MTNIFKSFRGKEPKAFTLWVLAVLGAITVIGTTLALVFDATEPITNTFTPADVELQMAGNTVTNTGDTPVYFRVALVFTWVNSNDGTILSVAPKENVDYTIHINTDNHWEKGSDGFWYYTVPVAPGTGTAQLVKDVSVLHDNITEGYELNVQVLAESIQTDPTEAVEESWGVSVSADGTLEIGGAANEG